MSTDPKLLSDAELEQSQWIDLGEITQLLDMALTDALRALKLRGLAAVRPALLDVLEEETLLTTCDDSHIYRCIQKVLTPHCDWRPDDMDDPDAATVIFHKLAFLHWLKGTDLIVDVIDLKCWKRDVLPELKRRGLLMGAPSGETPPNAPRTATRAHGKHIQLCDAPSYLGISRKLFEREVRPYVTAIEYPNVRGIWFDKEDLHARADAIKQQYGRPGEIDIQCPQPKHRKVSSYVATPGISTRLSRDDEFEKARARLPKK